ncbi:energy-coupling factor transporter transmembrane component T family protein [Pseudonocardia sp. CA-107938]|uniref:energy-coupling factor transporter transmembrane component T family protein n=1 Tax=Pseudonocardia sp. CA-107938 TaxID=3240021 RepID=UPI003D89E2D6
MLSIYHDARTPVHALPAWLKLACLLGAGIGLFLVTDPWVLGGFLLAVAVGFVVARVPARLAARQIGIALPFLAIILVVQVLVGGWLAALVVGLRILTLLALAGLVTLTTRADALIAVVEAALAPLRPLGVRPERVGMVVLMTIRFVPVLREHADGVRAAQRARGVERSIVFLTPLLVKTLRTADGLAQALDARGVDPGRAPRQR